MSGPFPGPRASAEPSHPLAPLSGRRVVVAGLISGAGGLAVALLLRATVAHTPVRVSSYMLFWSTVLLGAFALAAGMALEAVRQLQQRIPDHAYHRPRRGRRFR